MNDREGDQQTLACSHCRRAGGFSQPVSVVLVFAPGLDKPQPILPGSEHRICTRCDSVFPFIDKLCALDPRLLLAGGWTRAIVIFEDGAGLDVAAAREEHARPTQRMALA
jgi:RNA polymerase subunit RPABC4/transcription elongation factor Spt4